MQEQLTNKMHTCPIKVLLWKMGLPMLASMVLQALYNVVDSAFVANMENTGALANVALSIAFPVQILMIALGVGTGIGINAMLSKSLGEKNSEKVSFTAGNGIFLALCIYAIFLIFGLFLAKPFALLFSEDEQVVFMSTDYMRICCALSLGSIGYTVFERFLQATGKTGCSTIAQISGALTNVVLDYIFIYPLNLGVSGAAWATVIGQFVSLFMAMAFHYCLNKEIGNGIRFVRPKAQIIKGIYAIGASAAVMQALLSVMTAGVNAILSRAPSNSELLVGAFGIYYKIQQIALFSAFGISNTIITVLSFNYGSGNKKRAEQCVKYGITDSLIVTFVITVLFEIFAAQLAKIFSLAGTSTAELSALCKNATRIAAVGYVFMGYSVAVQGVLQALGNALKPLIISLLRLIVFVLPVAYVFTATGNAVSSVWWTFPIAEVATAVFSFIFLQTEIKAKLEPMPDSAEKANAPAKAQEQNSAEITKNIA